MGRIFVQMSSQLKNFNKPDQSKIETGFVEAVRRTLFQWLKNFQHRYHDCIKKRFEFILIP